MAETRIRIGKQLQKSTNVNSWLLSDSNNEAVWTAPPSGSNQLLYYTGSAWSSLGVGANLAINGGNLTATFGGITVQEEGTNLTARSIINFVGAGITATDDSANSRTNITLDADLSAIAALVGTSGFLKKTAADTWSLDTNTYLTGNQSITLSGDATGSGTTAITVTLANSGVTGGTYNNSATAVTPFTVDAKGRITSTGSAVTITPAWSSITSKPTTLSGFGITDALALSGGTMTGAITLAADPTQAMHAATKQYVDATAQGLDVKQSVKAATTANITLSGAQTIDAVSVVAGDRVLVKDQTAASGNGIYIVAAGAWTRATDMDAWTEVPGAFTFVEQGAVNADSGWVCTADQGGTLGSTAITFAQFSGAGQITAGAGLTKTGNTLDIGGTANRITVNTDSIDIASTYVGQSSITTLGTITTGTWTAGVIDEVYGGTGLSSYATGDILYASGTNTLAKRTIGSNGQVLKVVSGAPNWADESTTIQEAYLENSTASLVDLDSGTAVKDVDGTNVTMTVPDATKLFVYRNGMLLNRTGSATTRDYSINTGTSEITFAIALAADEVVKFVKIV